MEESKSVPGARKVRKSSSGSGARSGRSSRKSSHSSLASLTDSEIPETSETTGSGSVETAKKSIPNGTHSDEDKTSGPSGNKVKEASVSEGGKEKGDEAGKHGPSDKQGDDKNIQNVNNKTETVNILNTNTSPGQDVQKVESGDKEKSRETVKDVESSKQDTSVNETRKEIDKIKLTEKRDKCEGSGGDKDKKNKEKIVKKVKESETIASVQLKDKSIDRKSSVDDKNEKTDILKTGDKVSDKESPSKVVIDKKKDDGIKSKSALKNSGESTTGSENKKKESNLKEQSIEGKEKTGENKSKEEIKKVEEIVIKEAGCSKADEHGGINRLKSESDSSEDDANVKLNFPGFETPSNEKSTMFFRILDDIRIDDSIMEEMAEGEGDSESEKREEDVSMENFILEDDKTDYEGDYDCEEDIFAPEVVCVPMSCGLPYQFNKDDILSTTSSTPSLSSIKSSSSVPRKRARDRSGGVKKPPIDMSNPMYLKPFECGWKRELVFRSVSDTGSSKRNADIYYYTPKGKKVRSTREVVENLTDPDLTIDNFTFFKEPIGINDPEKEIIREAKIRGDRDLNATPPPAKKPALHKKLGEIKSPRVMPISGVPIESPVQDTGRIETNKSDELSPSKVAGSSLTGTPKIVLKSLKSLTKSKTSVKPLFTPPAKASSGSTKDKRHRDSEDELEMGMLPPLWPTPPDKGTAREISPSTKVTGTSSSKTIEVCSIRCPLAMGLIPTLQCHLCLCLYHPECVGLEEAINRTIHSYVCKNCQEAKKGGGISSTVLNKVTPPVLLSPPPLTPISTLGTNNGAGPSNSAALPKLQRLNDTKLPTTSKSQKIVGGVTTWLPPSSMIQLTSKNTSSSKTSVPAVATVETASSLGSMPAQTLMSMNGKRYVVVPKHNVLSVSPAITTSGLSVTDTQSPVSTFVSANSPTGDTTVSSSNVSNNTIGTSSSSPTVSSASVVPNVAPNNSNVPVLPKPPVVNPNDPSSRSFIMNNQSTPTNPPGVLLVPCVTTTANNTKEGSKYVIINGPTGLPTGNFIIGNIPPQQQLQLPAVPTTQPAVPSNESGGGVKRSNEDNDKLPPAKRAKKESPPKKEPAAPTTPSTAPKPVNSTSSPSAAKSPQSTSVTVVNPGSSLHKDFYMTNMSAIYKALLHSFQYLKVQELLRASRVCHLWRDIAHHKSLWQTVRMKNSKVRDWEGFANMLRNSGTKHLDLRKMLVSDKQETCGELWAKYSRAMEQVNMLLRIDMCRCPASAVENSVKYNKDLQVLTAIAIRSHPLDMAAFENCKNLVELRLKCTEKGGMELKNLSALKGLTRMKHLSLLTVKKVPAELAEVFQNLVNLESLEFSECVHLPEAVAVNGLSKLTKLQRLRLEKGQEPSCPTITILNTVSKLSSLVQLELINFDVKPGFNTALANCTNLRTLLIIPTYVTQSATTNHVVMEGVSKLSKTLMHFVWGITLELLRVTDLFIDQWDGQKSLKSPAAASPPSGALKKGSGDSIPILKPINEDSVKEGTGTSSQVDILQLPKLHKVLTALLPTTKIKILKVPFSATWRQTVTGPTNAQ